MTLPAIQQASVAWPEQGRWTYEDWLTLPDDGFRYEVVEGELFMSPPPNLDHQNAVSGLIEYMRRHARLNDLGLVLTAPIAVRIPGSETTVQPDILFVSKARENILRTNFIDGAPDLVVEVLSPNNWVYDRGVKQEAYRRAGVREYWLVDYRARIVDVLVLEGEEYIQRGRYGEGETAPSEVLTGFAVAVADIFAR